MKVSAWRRIGKGFRVLSARLFEVSDRHPALGTRHFYTNKLKVYVLKQTNKKDIEYGN
jgi:hypothetical protein